jgi:hypothetical protein
VSQLSFAGYGFLELLPYYKYLWIVFKILHFVSWSTPQPEEVRAFEKGEIEIVNLGNVVIGRAHSSQDGGRKKVSSH